MILRYFALVLFPALFLLTEVKAQHQELNEKPSIWKRNNDTLNESGTLAEAFRKGHVHGHFRYFFSQTNNSGDLTDYHAHAGGGGLRYESGKFHGFHIGVSGFFIYNLGSSDLSIPDSSTMSLNRYELGLFDIENPHNGNDIDRLEELYIAYSRNKSNLSFGKILINTPFINLQDGRMRPSGVQGAWFELAEWENVRVEGGYLTHFSPRSTTKWYRGGESIGIYPAGVDPSGAKSLYPGHVESKGTALLGIHVKTSETISLQAWNFTIDNVLNSALIQADFERKAGNTSFISAAQFIRQDAFGNGGSDIDSLAYVQQGNEAMTFGVKAGLSHGQWLAEINYNRITAHGRYLFPREWGRDPFFTFMSRERNEGFGDVHATTARIQWKQKNGMLKASLTGGYFSLPDVRNFALNKYGMPSYFQVNLDIRYSFTGILQGLEAQGLLVWKGKSGEVYDNDRYVINKVDMSLINVVVNYRF
ncbi:MAG: hypothetical protein RL220_322 [Bacteroidota bacterium]